MADLIPTIKTAKLVAGTTKEIVKASEAVAKQIRFIQKFKNYFKPFKPTTKSIEINYRTRKAILLLTAETPESVRKRHRKISIPKFSRFSVGFVQNDNFDTIDNAWVETDKEWILPIQDIPGNRFLIELQGEIDYRSLYRLVKTYSSANRDLTEEIDKYLLKAYISNIEFFERSFKSLIIQDIPFQVKVELSKAVVQTIPKNIQMNIDAYRTFREAAQTRDRSKAHTALLKAMRAEREGWTYETTRDFIQKISDTDFYKTFIEVKGNFNLTTMEKGYTSLGMIIPQMLNVNTETYLDLNQPISNGELIFQRKELQESLNMEFNKKFARTLRRKKK